MKFFDRLPHPHVISLERKQARRDLFFASAAERGLDGIEWFPAVDGALIPDLPEWARTHAGAYGCLRSHVELYKAALANGWEALTVFEDDVEFQADERGMVDELNRRPPETDHFNLYPPTGWCVGTFGYVIFPEFMRCVVRLVEAQPFPEGKFGHIDQLLMTLTSSQGWIHGASRRPLVIHRAREGGDSDIRWGHCQAEPGSSKKLDLVSTFVDTRAEPVMDPEVLVVIPSRRENRPRRDAIRETWLTGLPARMRVTFLITDGGGKEESLADEADTIQVDASGNGAHGGGVPVAMLRHALEGPHFDYLLRCGDDTYLRPERMLDLILPGVDLIGSSLLVRKHGYACGDAGYMLSRRLAEMLADGRGLPAAGPEDVAVSRAAIHLGATIRHSPLLGGSAAAKPQDLHRQTSICWCSPERMRELHGLLKHEPIAAIPTINEHWKDVLLFYASGEFRRVATSCSGTWLIDDGWIVLRWHAWPEEIMGAVSENEDFRQLADAMAASAG